MKSDDNPDLEDGELEDGELEDQEEDAPATPPAAPEIPAPSASTPSSAIKESHEEIGTKVLKNVATKASEPLYNPWFRYPGNSDKIKKLRKKMKIQKSSDTKYVDHDRLSQNEDYYNYDNAIAAWSRASNPNVALENNDNKEDDFTVELQRLKMLQRKEQSGLKGPYDSPSDDDDLDNEEALQSKKIRAGNGEPSTSDMDGGDKASLDSSDESSQSNSQPTVGGKRKQDKFTDGEKPSKKRRLADTPWDERPLCKFFMDGKCSKGSDCPFNHSGKPEKQEQPCKQFQKSGTCHYGDNCKFSHSPIREEFGKMSVWANGVGDGDHSAPKKRTLLDGPPLEKKKKIPSLFDIDVGCPKNSDPDKQESIQKKLKEAAQKSIYGPTKHQSPVMRHHVPQGVRKPGLLGMAPKNMMGPGSMMSAARSMPFGFSNESGPSNRHGDFGFQNGRMFNFNEQQQQPNLFGIDRVSNNDGWQQQQQPNLFGIDRVSNKDGWQQQQPLFSEHPTVPQKDTTIQSPDDHVCAGSPPIDAANSGHPMDQADDKVGLLNCDDNVQMPNNEQATSTNFLLDKDERLNVNKEEKMIVDTDQKEETSAKVDENAAQLVSSVDEMKPVKEEEEEQRYLGGFDLYSLPPAQRDLYRRIYQQPKTSAVDAATKMEEKSSAVKNVNSAGGDKWYSSDEENSSPTKLVIGTDVNVPVASVPVASVPVASLPSLSQSLPTNIMNLLGQSMQTSMFSQPAFDINKLLSTSYQKTENIGHQELELEVNGLRGLNLPYCLREMTVDETIRLPSYIDLTDPKWDNDPRVQKHKNDKPILGMKPMPPCTAAPIMPQQNTPTPTPPSVPTRNTDPRLANRDPRRAKMEAKAEALPPVQSSSNVPPLMQVGAVSTSHQQQQQQQQQQGILGAAPPFPDILSSLLTLRPNTALPMNMLLNSMQQGPQVQNQQDLLNNMLRSLIPPSVMPPSGMQPSGMPPSSMPPHMPVPVSNPFQPPSFTSGVPHPMHPGPFMPNQVNSLMSFTNPISMPSLAADPSSQVNTSVNNIMPSNVGGVSNNPDSCATKDAFVRPTTNYRQDPRLRKKATPSAAAQSSGELENRREKSSSNSEQPSSAEEVKTVEAEVGKKSLRDMNITEFRSPLMQRSSESSSAISGYGRPPNKKYEEMTAERNQKRNHKGGNKTFGNSKHEARNIGQQFVAPTLPAMPMMAMNEFIPPQPEGSVKDMFKTIDPTASPFC